MICRGDKKINWVNWSTIVKEKEKGGLVIRSISSMNKALLGKWIWRFGEDQEALWKRVITAKYGEDLLGWISG